MHPRRQPLADVHRHVDALVRCLLAGLQGREDLRLVGLAQLGRRLLARPGLLTGRLRRLSRRLRRRLAVLCRILVLVLSRGVVLRLRSRGVGVPGLGESGRCVGLVVVLLLGLLFGLVSLLVALLLGGLRLILLVVLARLCGVRLVHEIVSGFALSVGR